MGNNASKDDTRKCQGTAHNCGGRQTTSLPQACSLAEARRPIERPVGYPCADAHGRVAARPATDVRHTHALSRIGSATYPPARHGCLSYAPCTRPRRTSVDSLACAPCRCPRCTPFDCSACMPLAQPVRTSVPPCARQSPDAPRRSQNILEDSRQG